MYLGECTVAVPVRVTYLSPPTFCLSVNSTSRFYLVADLGGGVRLLGRSVGRATETYYHIWKVYFSLVLRGLAEKDGRSVV